MKSSFRSSLFVSSVLVIALQWAQIELARAQTVALTSVNAAHFCPGDSIVAVYTASGTFLPKNAFTIQLSNPMGSFTTFTNVGSTVSSHSGTITTVAPNGPEGSHYRLRIVSTNPYIIGNDNGIDLSFGIHPRVNINVNLKTNTNCAFVGDTLTFATFAQLPAGTILNWDFGAGATPATGVLRTTSYSVSYSTAGMKRIVVNAQTPSGCTQDTSRDSSRIELTVLGCNPQIPAKAMVDSVSKIDVNSPYPQGYVWVNGGIDFQSRGYNTIFAEPGSMIHLGINDVVFLKPGASMDGGFNSIIVYAPGASINGPDDYRFRHLCPNLAFDYSVAPPNLAMHNLDVLSVATKDAAANPNPSRSRITFHSQKLIESIEIVNAAGVTALDFQHVDAAEFSATVGTLPKGVYYAVLKSHGSTRVERFIVD